MLFELRNLKVSISQTYERLVKCKQPQRVKKRGNIKALYLQDKYNLKSIVLLVFFK